MSEMLAARHEYDFIDFFAVVCPSCKQMAEVGRKVENSLVTRRLTRLQCGLTKFISPRCKGIVTSPASDNLLNGLDLWFQIRSRWGVLYAYNRDHLSYIRSYVAASLRKVSFAGVEYRNNSIASRLPAWVKAAKNRQEILKAIDKALQK